MEWTIPIRMNLIGQTMNREARDYLAHRCLCSLKYMCLYFGIRLGPSSTPKEDGEGGIAMAYIGNTYYYLKVRLPQLGIEEGEVLLEHMVRADCMIFEEPLQVVVACSNPDCVWSEAYMEPPTEDWFHWTKFGIVVRD
jgi:hypothetical protein